MPTNCKKMPRGEIFNCKNEVYITFDAGSREKFTISFEDFKIAYEFVICLRKNVEEVEQKGHYHNSDKISVFTDAINRLGNIKFGEKEFSYEFSEETDPKAFHQAFSQTIWGDTAD